MRRPHPTLVSVGGLPIHTGPHPSSLSDVPSGVYVDDVFAEISALPSTEREAALAARCANHPSVEVEVRALLSADRGTEAYSDPDVSVRVGRGAMLGRYRLEEPLGAGATASVWKSWDTQLLSYTALKLLHPDARLQDREALDAVLREARAASGIISDHVVRIKTAGRFEGGGPAFVEMELCAEYAPGPDGEVLEIGRTLADADLRGLGEIVRVVAEAARGVEAAHRAGVLHRDLKPGNILLTPQSRRAKVTDFGLAAEQVYPAPTAATPTTATVTVLLEARDGRIVGTPAYMAPEQALGHPPTRAVDVYALGATLYSLVARVPPYEPDGRHAIPALDVLAQVRKGPPRPLRERAGIPARLDRIVSKAMARSPRDRYRTAADLAKDLEAWLGDHPTSVDVAVPVLRPALWARRHRTLVGTTSVLLVALMSFALAVGWLEVTRRSLQSDIGDAQVRLGAAVAEAAEAERLRDLAQTDLAAAQLEVAAAREARERALVGESQAEARWREEITLRKTAEQARLAAEDTRQAAELGATASRTERDLALAQREASLAEARRAQEEADLAAAAREAEEQARLDTEDALRRARLELVESEGRVEELEAELARTKAALDAAISAGVTE